MKFGTKLDHTYVWKFYETFYVINYKQGDDVKHCEYVWKI
jgi:hypothetical protein